MSYQLSQEAKDHIDAWTQKFPTDKQRSAIIASLQFLQHENHGYINEDQVKTLAAYLDIPVIQIWEVATFYSMFQTKPVGKTCIAVCTNISCMLRGSDQILSHIEKRLGIKVGESTQDGKFFLKKEEECLAACCGAPMLMVDHDYHENLDTEKVDQILDSLGAKI